MAIKIVSALAGAADANKAASRSLCEQIQGNYPITGSGSILAGSDVVPADYFARKINDGGIWVQGAPKLPSFFGMTLCLALEGAPVDGGAVDWNALNKNHAAPGSGGITSAGWVALRDNPIVAGLYDSNPGLKAPSDAAGFQKLIEANIKAQDDAYRNQHPEAKGAQLGPSAARRAQFRLLRQAIDASYRPATGTRSDGGAALWILYLDLLREEWKQGHLTGPWLAWVLARRPAAYEVQIMTGPWGDETTYATGQDQGCASQAANQILNLAQQWDRAVDPRYTQGQEKLAEVQAQAQQVAIKNGAVPPVSAQGAALAAKNLVVSAKQRPLLALGLGALAVAGVVAVVRARRR
jgi:hypothetical protein